MKNFVFQNIKISLFTGLVFLSLFISDARSQCTNTISYGSATAPTGAAAVNISTCNYQTEYSTISSVVGGSTYSLTNSSGGCITVHSGTPNGPVVTFGLSPLSFTAPSSGTYYLHYNTTCACGTATTCGTTTITCTSCGGGGGAPCSSILAITGCGTGVSASMSGTGIWNTSFCGWSTPGVESIFSFTPTTTGIHSINVTGATGGFVDFGWKLASAGCSSGGWNCIDDVGAAGNYGAMNWTAGVTYYILLDPETTSAVNFTFNVGCPNPPPVVAGDCATAYTICTNANFSIDPNGYGMTNEICMFCTSNPNTNPSSANSGCLLSGELNSTWMLVNVAAGGTLEFSLGAAGGGNCYDWSMWPYSATACAAISAGTLAPNTCNYNGSCDSYTGVTSALPPGAFANNFEPTINAVTGSQYLICFSNYSGAVTSVPLNFFGTANISCTPLPVEMIEFLGRGMRGYDELKWSTLVEINSDYFEIERSWDGFNFEAIGNIQATGGSSERTDYQFEYDVNQGDDRYYRLKQFDVNGMFKYSDIIIVYRELVNEFRIVEAYPNPATDEFNVYFNLPQDGNVSTRIISSSGRNVLSSEAFYGAGGNIVKLPLDDLMSGFYFVELTFNDGESTDVVKLIVK